LAQRQERRLIRGVGQLKLSTGLPRGHASVGDFQRGRQTGVEASLDDFQQSIAERLGIGGQIANLTHVERRKEQPFGLSQII
jgi:hypothetical protein